MVELSAAAEVFEDGRSNEGFVKVVGWLELCGIFRARDAAKLGSR